MITVDTNVMVGILIDDGSNEQIRLARDLVAAAEQVFIPKLVQIELIWVLARSYQ